MKSFSTNVLKLMFCGSVLISLYGCKQQSPEQSLTLPRGLSVETHLLEAKPKADFPLTFAPVQETQEEILARHSQERLLNAIPFILVEGNVTPGQNAYTSADGTLTAIQFSYNATKTTSARRVVQVLQDDQVIYTIQAGDVSPYHSFQGLWKYDEHWVLETAHVTTHRSSDSNKVWGDTKGQIVQDGELLNELYGYEEAFGFQLMRGRPFYFYKRDDQIGFSYDGQEIDLGYSQVPHYWCCSAFVLNPVQAENMVAFFAQHEGQWYYVEIGFFDINDTTLVGNCRPTRACSSSRSAALYRRAAGAQGVGPSTWIV